MQPTLRTHEIRARQLSALRAQIRRDTTIEERAEYIESLLDLGETPAINEAFARFAIDAAYNQPIGKVIEDFAHDYAKKEIEEKKLEAQLSAEGII
jgi:hypothetical protein